MKIRPATVIALLTLLALAGATSEAWARAGSGGSRGSRSYSSPARPAPLNPGAPVSPSRPATPPPSTPRPSMFGGLMGAIGGFMLGGLLGGLLFGGFGGLGSGIGLLDILLVAGGVFLLFKFMQSRRQQQPQPAYAGAAGWSGGATPGPAATAVAEPAAVETDLERGLAHIRQMDATFDAAALAADAAETFRTVQAAVTARDVGPLRARVAPELFARLEQQCEELRRGGQINRLERIEIDRAEVTEAWQERGQDYVTVVLTGTLLDYVVDTAGRVVTGSPTVPERFEEFWTFTRSVGRQPWRLTAIQTG